MDIIIEITEIIAESTINETVIYCDVIISDAGGSMVDVPIETASANGVPIPIVNKNIDIIIPTKTSDLTKDDVYTKSETYTQTEINNKLSAVYKFKGSVLTYAELPTDAENADVWNVEENGVNYAWVEATESWDSLGGLIGLATLTENGLLSKEDFAIIQNLPTTYAHITHDHAGQVINPEGIKLDTVNPLVVATAGEIGWNAADGTVNLQLLNNTKLQIGQELHIYGKASETISNRNVIQFAGVQGDHILIKKAVQSEISVNPTLVMGIATQNIASGSFGYVTWFGKVNDVFTTGFSLSDMLYFDSSGVVAGAITNIAPTAPNRKILLATVIKLQTGASENGIIMVRPTFGTKLADLDDVDGTDTTIADTDEVLKKDTAGLWKKVTWANVKTLLGGTFVKKEPVKWLVYKALLTQAGESGPTARVLNQDETDYLGDIEWIRESPGLYKSNILFEPNLIAITSAMNIWQHDAIDGSSTDIAEHYNPSTGEFEILTRDGEAMMDDMMISYYVEIKVRQRGSAPVLLSAETNEVGDKVILTFDKKMSQYKIDSSLLDFIIISGITGASTSVSKTSDYVYEIDVTEISSADNILMSYNGNIIESFDYGLLATFENLHIVNNVS